MNNRLHFVVLGMGAVGGFYGLRLAKYLQTLPNEFDLSFISRGGMFDALKQGATLIDCDEETKFTELNCFESFDQVQVDGPVVVLLCVKSKDTIDAVKTISGDVVVVSIQNGVENEERIASIIGKENTIGALTNIAAEVLEPGRYINKGKYSLLLGELDGVKTERIQKIAEVFKKAGINIKVTNDIYKQLWSKLVWNAAFNPTSVYYNMTVGELLADAKIREQITGIMQEVKIVAQALGYELAGDVAEKHIARTDTPEWSSFRTSMLQDHQKGKPIELDDLLGVIVRKGKEKGIATPYASKLYKDMQ